MDGIRIENLQLRILGKVLLEGFSLHLPKGQHCTLTGPSGCGKSTLLKCLLGFWRPAAGRIELLGTRMNAASVWELRRRVAWVAQEPELGEGTVLDALQRPFGYKANKELSASLERLHGLLESFLLGEEILDQPVARLSGGEKQRIAMIAALLLERPILLLDEASSALDATSRQAVAGYLARRTSTTILSVSHNPENFQLGGPVIELRSNGGGDGTD